MEGGIALLRKFVDGKVEVGWNELGHEEAIVGASDKVMELVRVAVDL